MYKALKTCKFAGKDYKIGDTIDTSVILPEAAPRLMKMGVIAAVGENSGVKSETSNAADSKAGAYSTPASTIVKVPILDEETEIESVDVTPEELVEVVTIIQLPDEELTEKVQEIQSENQLLLIAILNGGPVAYEAAKARVAELNANDGDPEQTGDPEETGEPEKPENPEETGEPEKPGDDEAKTYSKNALSKMNKAGLLAVAEEKGVKATADMTNDAIIELIIQKQGE